MMRWLRRMSLPGRVAMPGSPTERGQGLVEFAMVTPVLLLLLAGVVEVGLVANDSLTIGYGSREGARAGSALGRGGVQDCLSGDDPGGVDQTIVAGVQRIIESTGSGVQLGDITEIRVFKATSSGAKVEDRVNVWQYTGEDSGPDIDPGSGVSRLDFSPVDVDWPACSRVSGGANPDILGVEVAYDRGLVSPLASLMRSFGLEPVVTLSETTVMTLNPTSS